VRGYVSVRFAVYRIMILRLALVRMVVCRLFFIVEAVLYVSSPRNAEQN
jgi:hypothetical protein